MYTYDYTYTHVYVRQDGALRPGDVRGGVNDQGNHSPLLVEVVTVKIIEIVYKIVLLMIILMVIGVLHGVRDVHGLALDIDADTDIDI